jgi:UDP-N-acetylglucosamine 2-epimerase
MNCSAVMLGNSSSGIVEAASFELPVVDIGDRQRGRVCSQNIVHTEPDRESIVKAARMALSPSFRRSLRSLKNPYGDGHAAQRIIEVVKKAPLGRDLLVKRFHNLGKSQSTGGYSAKTCTLASSHG